MNRVKELDAKFEQRPTLKELVDSNIIRGKSDNRSFSFLKGTEIAGALSATLQTIKFQKTISTLDHKLEKRPTALELTDQNILQGK